MLNDEINRLHVVGRLGKRYGHKGWLRIKYLDNVERWRERLQTHPFLFIKVASYFVPFHVVEYDEESLLIRFEIRHDDELDMLIGKEVALPIDEDDHGYIHENFESWTIVEARSDRPIGMIDAVYSHSEYSVAILDNAFASHVPLVDEWILELDHENRMIKMNLPDGLLDLSSIEDE